MDRTVIVNSKQQNIYNLAVQVLHERLTIVEFSLLANKSYRQSQRIIKRVEEKQMLGLMHGNLGRSPTNKIDQQIKIRVIDLMRTKYYDFNLTHLQEKLREVEGVIVKRETLRKWGHEAELVKRTKRRGKGRAHKPRPRMPKAGMLIQFDGSEHDWFSGLGPMCTLIGGLDDATGEILGLEFFPGEDSLNCMKVMQSIVGKYGVPNSFYLDQAGYFGKTYREQDTSQIGRALDQIGCRIILARSPQAKGKIERLWGTLQDRLVPELRLQGITRIPAANDFLNNSFVEQYNKKFSVLARESEASFRGLARHENLKEIFCYRETRKINNGNTFSYGPDHYLIEEKQNLRFRTIYIKTYCDGSKGYEVFGKAVTVRKLGASRALPAEFKKSVA